jgi:hypothetical protein
MHKTFTDCYFDDDFTGGGWGYALNSNDAEGVDVQTTPTRLDDEKSRKLAYYLLGWNSIAVSRETLLLRIKLIVASGTPCVRKDRAFRC